MWVWVLVGVAILLAILLVLGIVLLVTWVAKKVRLADCARVCVRVVCVCVPASLCVTFLAEVGQGRAEQPLPADAGLSDRIGSLTHH